MQPSFVKPNQHEILVGATEELSLRVSVAALVSVLFDDPEDGRTMLALECTAALREIEGRPEVTVRAKPFGGGVRLTNPQALKGMIGHFHTTANDPAGKGTFAFRYTRRLGKK